MRGDDNRMATALSDAEGFLWEAAEDEQTGEEKRRDGLNPQPPKRLALLFRNPGSQSYAKEIP
ncbi:hypothetical protein IMZ48_17360 [Candidatus Bathyarchaeota archaeon]|nr:hypothetical protein [Candidatus Bathyarchaeota archaeon]